MAELLLILGLGAAVAYWFDAMGARDAALRAARAACDRHGLQLLDESVAVVRTRLARNRQGHACLRRVFRFEFSHDGGDRREGSVEILGRRALNLRLDLAPFTLYENTQTPAQDP